MPDAARHFFVITLHGQVGPLDLAALRERLAGGALAASDQVRSAFGRPLGTVQEVLAATRRGASSGGLARTPDPVPPPDRHRMPVGLLIGIGVLLALAALLAFRRGGEAYATPPPTHHAQVVVVAKPVAPAPTTPTANVAPPKAGPPPPPAPVAQPLAPDDQVWMDDAMPTGAKQHESSVAWKWAAATDPVPFTGRLALSSSKDEQFSCAGAVPLRIAPGDTLFAHVWIDPQRPPTSLMLKWYDGKSWEHRAFWGTAGYSAARDKKYGNVRMGDLPQAGTWVRLEVPVARVGLEGIDVLGLALANNGGGQVLWDCVGRRPKR